MDLLSHLHCCDMLAAVLILVSANVVLARLLPTSLSG